MAPQPRPGCSTSGTPVRPAARVRINDWFLPAGVSSILRAAAAALIRADARHDLVGNLEPHRDAASARRSHHRGSGPLSARVRHPSPPARRPSAIKATMASRSMLAEFRTKASASARDNHTRYQRTREQTDRAPFDQRATTHRDQIGIARPRTNEKDRPLCLLKCSRQTLSQNNEGHPSEWPCDEETDPQLRSGPVTPRPASRVRCRTKNPQTQRRQHGKSPEDGRKSRTLV